jgi:hypothetical protein
MRITQINKIETFYRTYQEEIDSTEIEESIITCTEDNEEVEIVVIWKDFIENVLSLNQYHALYYPDKLKIHSKGVNIYAIDMMTAVEMFASEFGYDPYYIMFKDKSK